MVAIRNHSIVNGIGKYPLEIPNATPNARISIVPTRVNIFVIVVSIFVSISALLSMLASRLPRRRRSSWSDDMSDKEKVKVRNSEVCFTCTYTLFYQPMITVAGRITFSSPSLR